MDPMNVMGLPTSNPTHSTSNLPQTANNGPNNGYRCGSNTSSSSGRGSSIQHASLPRHFNSRTASENTAVSPLSEVPGPPLPTSTMGGMPIMQMGMPNTVGPAVGPPPGLSNPPLPTVSAQIQHHYNNKYNRYSNQSGYQYNSHYRGPPPPTQPRSRPVQNNTNNQQLQAGIPPTSSNTSDYARYNTNVGKQIDV